MINRIKISDDVELVFSQNECGYREVINDFKNAAMIKIVTFNISTENTRLLDEVKNLRDTTDVEIITNIPNRYVTYYSDRARSRARKNITSYVEQLNPENYNPMTSSYFNFNNHSKIILTENIAYIGSANASDESDNNFEGGVIVRDRKAINEIIRTIIPVLKEDSVEYYGNGLSRYIILLLNLLTRTRRIRVQFHYSFYSINDHRGADIEYYNNYNADLSPILIEEIEALLYEYEEIVRELDDSEEFDISNIQNYKISSILTRVKDLYDFSIYDIGDKSNEYLEEYSYIAYEENLDKYAQITFDRANEEKINLANEIEDAVVEVEQGIDNIFASVQNLYEYVLEYIQLNEEIDNT